MSEFKLLVIATIFSALSACDTVPIVASSIPWNSEKVDQECIHRAIDATQGLHFERQDVRDADPNCVAITGECDKRIFETYYRVMGNQDHTMAVVEFTEMRNGKLRPIENRAAFFLGVKFSDADRAGYRKAIIALNDSIAKSCPSAGKASEPKR